MLFIFLTLKNPFVHTSANRLINLPVRLLKLIKYLGKLMTKEKLVSIVTHIPSHI